MTATLPLRRALARMRTWFAARTPRERTLIALAAAVLSAGASADLGVRMFEARTHASELAVQRQDLERQARAQSTPAFRAAADAGARAARRASIGGETIHVARARAQAEVESAAASAGLTGVTVALEPRPAAAAIVEPIAMRVDGRYEADAFAAFLARLAQSEQSFAPGAVDVSGAGREGRFRLDVTAYALVTERAG